MMPDNVEKIIMTKEVGYKCFTMADTQELEHIWNLLEEIE